MNTPATEAVIAISRRAAARLRQGHVWVYRSDIVSGESAPGTLVSVADQRGNLIGTALYSSASQIALRMFSSGPLTPAGLPAAVRQRLLAALAYREKIFSDAATNACRLVFSEADFLPGLIVDRYNDIVVLQFVTQAMDEPGMRETVCAVLNEQLHPAAIAERVEARVRELEQLPLRSTGLLAGDKTQTTFSLNGVRFHYDALAGQKTGAFLDQRENYAAAAGYARGEALDLFCYQGGFALHLAQRCARVTAVDSSRPALETAERNQELNPGLAPVDWIEANAFDLLRDYAAAKRQYDVIVLDPPAFAKSRRELRAALRGYKELNLRALKMLRPGGVLVTCSCSYHVAEAEFMDVVRAAAADVRRQPRLLEKRGQSSDHPVLLTVPETAYLKCLILQL